MNNASVHCNSWIEEFIISHECQISYLSHWIDDLSLIWMSDAIFVFLLAELQVYNFIKLIFSVLKIWVHKHFDKTWFHFENIFNDFLHYAVERSKCDKYSRQHFKHSNYIFEINIKALKWELKIENRKFDSKIWLYLMTQF